MSFFFLALSCTASFESPWLSKAFPCEQSPLPAGFGSCTSQPASPRPTWALQLGGNQKQAHTRNCRKNEKLCLSFSGRAKETYPYTFDVCLYFGKLLLVSSHFTVHCLLPPQPGCLNFFFRTLWIQSFSWQLSKLGLTRKLKYFPRSSYQETMCQTRWN